MTYIGLFGALGLGFGELGITNSNASGALANGTFKKHRKDLGIHMQAHDRIPM